MSLRIDMAGLQLDYVVVLTSVKAIFVNNITDIPVQIVAV